MAPIPDEGGWFCQTWRSPDTVPGGTLPRYRADKPAGTAILALFCEGPDGFSALHRLPTTEVWHFCGGDAFVLLLLGAEGSSAEVVPGPDGAEGHQVQVPVPPGTWMGGHMVTGGRYSLLGCTIAPGFTADDLEVGRRDELIAAYPDRADKISRLTRITRLTR
jgi:uncharacterized protein